MPLCDTGLIIFVLFSPSPFCCYLSPILYNRWHSFRYLLNYASGMALGCRVSPSVQHFCSDWNISSTGEEGILMTLAILWLFLWRQQQVTVFTNLVKQLDICYMDPTLRRCILLTFPLVPRVGWHFWFNVNVSTTTAWIATTFPTHVHAPLRVNCSNFGDPLTVLLVPWWGQHFKLSSNLFYDQIPAKLMAVPSASAVLSLHWHLPKERCDWLLCSLSNLELQ